MRPIVADRNCGLEGFGSGNASPCRQSGYSVYGCSAQAKFNFCCVPVGCKTEILAKVEQIIPARGLCGESIEGVIEAMVRAHRPVWFSRAI